MACYFFLSRSYFFIQSLFRCSNPNNNNITSNARSNLFSKSLLFLRVYIGLRLCVCSMYQLVYVSMLTLYCKMCGEDKIALAPDFSGRQRFGCTYIEATTATKISKKEIDEKDKREKNTEPSLAKVMVRIFIDGICKCGDGREKEDFYSD